MATNGQSNLYGRVALAVAVLAILIVGAAAIADDAEAQAITDPAVTLPEATTTTTPEVTTTTTPDATTTTPATTTPATTTPESPDPAAGEKHEGEPRATASRGRLRLKVSNATPGEVILDSRNPAHFKFAL